MKPFVKKSFDRTVSGVTAVCVESLTKAGMTDDAAALSVRTASAANYKEALTICLDYVVIDFG